MDFRTKIGLGSAALAALLLIAAPGQARAQGAQPPATQAGPQFGQQFGATGSLGIYGVDVTAEAVKELKLPEQSGLRVMVVNANTPAAKAGLKKDDVIIDYDGQKIEGAVEFQRLVRETPPGRDVQMVIWRDGHMENLSAQIAQAPAERRGGNEFYGGAPAPPGPAPNFRYAPGFGPGNGPQQFPGGNGPFNQGIAPTATLGISVENLSGQLGQYFGAPNGEGVLVTEVGQGSAGEKAGLKAGDVILKLDNEAVHNVGELRAHAIEHRSDASVMLNVLRKGSEISLTVTPQQPPQGLQPRGGRQAL